MLRILIVEDEPLVARAVERALLQAGHATEIASNGADGLSRAETGEHDLIVLDVLLPELDGLMVCRELRQRKVHIPILMLTARDAVADRVRGLDAGADDYLAGLFFLLLDERGAVLENPQEVDITGLHLGRIFDRFYRIDRTRAHATGGAGLGLAIAHALVAAHGGGIELSSRPGGGTLATIWLPTAHPADGRNASPRYRASASTVGLGVWAR